MMNKTLLLSLQKGILKELCSNNLLSEEQAHLAIKEFEQIYKKNLIQKEIENTERNEF